MAPSSSKQDDNKSKKKKARQRQHQETEQQEESNQQASQLSANEDYARDLKNEIEEKKAAERKGATPKNPSRPPKSNSGNARGPPTKGVGVLVSPPSSAQKSAKKGPLHPASKAAAKGRDAMNLSLEFSEVVGALPAVPPRRVTTRGAVAASVTKPGKEGQGKNDLQNSKNTLTDSITSYRSERLSGVSVDAYGTHEDNEDDHPAASNMVVPSTPGAHAMIGMNASMDDSGSVALEEESSEDVGESTNQTPAREPRREISLVNAVPVPDAETAFVGSPSTPYPPESNSAALDVTTANNGGGGPQLAIPMTGEEQEEHLRSQKGLDWRILSLVFLLLLVITGLVVGLVFGLQNRNSNEDFPTAEPSESPSWAPSTFPSLEPTKVPTLQDGTPKPTVDMEITPSPTAEPTVARIGTKAPALLRLLTTEDTNDEEDEEYN